MPVCGLLVYGHGPFLFMPKGPFSLLSFTPTGPFFYAYGPFSYCLLYLWALALCLVSIAVLTVSSWYTILLSQYSLSFGLTQIRVLISTDITYLIYALFDNYGSPSSMVPIGGWPNPPLPGKEDILEALAIRVKQLHAEMRDHFTFSIKSVILQHFFHFLGPQRFRCRGWLQYC